MRKLCIFYRRIEVPLSFYGNSLQENSPFLVSWYYRMFVTHVTSFVLVSIFSLTSLYRSFLLEFPLSLFCWNFLFLCAPIISLLLLAFHSWMPLCTAFLLLLKYLLSALVLLLLLQLLILMPYTACFFSAEISLL